MSIAPYIKVIGRGKEGARALDAAQAHDLMSQVLDGQASDLEVGAFALAMRIKGESLDELTGFLAATHERCLRLAHEAAPVLLLPSYNGARRLPNLTPLLGLLAARQGLPVLMHGVLADYRRVTTTEVLQALGLRLARDAATVTAAWSRGEPAFMPIDDLCPPLARLLDVRRVVGVRNSGHTIAKLLDPTGGAPSLRVVNYTHPEYAQSLAAFLQHTRGNAMLMRGTEGEPVADARRLRRLEVYLEGELCADLSCAAEEAASEQPVLPPGSDADATAHYIESVLRGDAPIPSPISQQADALQRAARALAAGRRESRPAANRR